MAATSHALLRPHHPTLHRTLQRAATTGLTLVVAAATLLVAGLAIGPRLLPYRSYAIQSGSMQPTLAVGSTVVLRPVQASRLRVGDIITFRRPGEPGGTLVTHRIARVEHRRGRTFFVTKGDANAVTDAWRV